jgi:hypothetical protein
VEDTILAKSGGLQILSIDSDWPMIEISGRLRPGLLRK